MNTAVFHIFFITSVSYLKILPSLKTRGSRAKGYIFRFRVDRLKR